MDTLETFRLYLLREKGQKPSTVHTNLKLVRKTLTRAPGLLVDDIQNFVYQMIGDGKKISYINQHIILLRFWGECFDLDHLKNYPYCKLREKRTYTRATMSDEEIEAFLNLPNTNKYKGYYVLYEMWTLFWMICAYHGPRMGEVARLQKFPTADNQSYVDFGRNMILFDQKSGPRLVPISFIISKRLREFVECSEEGFLFKTLFGKPLTSGAWRHDFAVRIKRLEGQFPGISRRMNLNPYSIRHSAATRWIEENWSLSAVQKAMGHRKLSTTEKYIHMSNKPVEKMINGDRIATPYKKGVDLISHFTALLQDAGTKYPGKLLINIKKTTSGKRLVVVLEATD